MRAGLYQGKGRDDKRKESGSFLSRETAYNREIRKLFVVVSARRKGGEMMAIPQKNQLTITKLHLQMMLEAFLVDRKSQGLSY